MRGTVLVLGARSGIGMAVAREFAALGHPVQLAARGAAEMWPDAADIGLRYAVAVTLHEFDALATATHEAFVDSLPDLPQIAVCAVGLMGDQPESERDGAAAAIVLRSNFEGPASILGVLANRFEARGSGVIVGISSVAGERGRATNYVYGAAKAGFTAFLSGLRNRLARRGVHVVTCLPGFVATRMTEGMDLPPLLTAQPPAVARAVARACRRRVDVIYTPGIWRVVMALVRAIPESVFKKMNL